MPEVSDTAPSHLATAFTHSLWACYLKTIQLGSVTVLEPQKYAFSTVCALLYSNPAPSIVYTNSPKAPVAKSNPHLPEIIYMYSAFEM